VEKLQTFMQQAGVDLQRLEEDVETEVSRLPGGTACPNCKANTRGKRFCPACNFDTWQVS
jgi:hypothetical protein